MSRPPVNGDDDTVSIELRKLERLIGQELSIAAPPYLTFLDADAVRHWTRATGDRNPRYEAGAEGQAEAPPTLLYAFSPLAVGYRGGLGGFHSLFGGSHWKWSRRLLTGVEVASRSVLTGVTELPSRFAGQMFKQTTSTEFRGTDGTLLAEVSSWGMRTRRKRSGGDRARRLPALPHYEPGDLAGFAHEYRREAEFVRSAERGTDLRRVGAELPTMIRGPYSTATAVGFAQAWGGVFIASHGYWYELLERHPKLGVTGASGVPESPEAVHWNPLMARELGLANSYDYGPERVAWASIFLTNWLGRSGDLVELYCEVRGLNYAGDVVRFSGAVIEIQDDEATVSLTGTNGRAEVCVTGWAKVKFHS